MTVKPIQLSHVNMFVRNKERSEKFYADILGLTVMNRMPRITFMSANESTSHEIALVEIGDDAPGPERGRVGLNHMAWQMGTFETSKRSTASSRPTTSKSPASATTTSLSASTSKTPTATSAKPTTNCPKTSGPAPATTATSSKATTPSLGT